MKILKFNYTDAKGKQSERVLLATTNPTAFHAGTDLSELAAESPEELDAYIQERKALYEEYVSQLAELDEEYDLKYRYRQFTAANMRDVVCT